MSARPPRWLAAAGAIASVALTGCALDRTYAIQKSMEPTILSGEIIDVDHDAYATEDPQDGDIVDLHGPVDARYGHCGAPRRPGQPCSRIGPLDPKPLLIKRVVAGPGERISIGAQGGAILNGRALDEPYIQPCLPDDRCALPIPITVPAGEYFVLGDNRPYSSDSRYWGPVPRSAIDGRVTPPDPSRR